MHFGITLPAHELSLNEMRLTLLLIHHARAFQSIYYYSLDFDLRMMIRFSIFDVHIWSDIQFNKVSNQK